MANDIKLKKILAEAKASADLQFPLRELINTEISSEIGSATGGTVDVKIRNVGQTYKQWNLTGIDNDLQVGSVPVTVGPYRTIMSYSDYENTLELGDDKDALIDNWTAGLVDKIADDTFNSIMLGANYAEVATTASINTLSNAINQVRSAKMAGQINGILSHDIETAIMNSSSTNYAFSDAKLASKYMDGLVGNWNGVNFGRQVADQLEITKVFADGSATFTLDTDGSATLKIAATSAPAAAYTIKAGTVFTVKNVYGVNMFGKGTSKLRSFVVQEDVTMPATTAATTVKVGPVYFSGARKNAHGTPVTDSGTTTVTGAIANKFAAGKTYVRGAVFYKNDVLGAMKAIKAQAENSCSTRKAEGVPLRLVYESDGRSSKEDLIIDTLYGTAMYSRRGVAGIYLQID